MGLGKQEEKLGGNRAFWPLLGFLMLIALGTISWFIAPAVRDFAFDTFGMGAIAGAGASAQEVQLLFAFITFVILASLAGLIVAFAAPKRSINVREGDLMKERKQFIKEREDRKKRRRDLSRKQREQSR